MKPGDVVRIVCDWSNFHGKRGKVVRVHDPLDVARLPYALVDVGDGDEPLRFGLRELEVEAD